MMDGCDMILMQDRATENFISQLVLGYKIPRMIKIRQSFDVRHIDDINGAVSSELQKEAILKRLALIHEGDSVAITAGSRFISHLPEILKYLISEVMQRGGKPFIVPAMGSHGGATGEGQRLILDSFGINERTMGVPIESSMETLCLGKVDDARPVFMDANAARADHIIVVNRIKPHTCFRGSYESGLMKMMVIGLGKQKGAEMCHDEGFGRMARNIELFGHFILGHAPILFGLGIVENAYDQTYVIKAIEPSRIAKEEPDLLCLAKEKLGKLLFPSCDILVVDQIGKNISGSGMDPNITGRFVSEYASGGIKAQRVAVLDLTEESHANCIGVGVADVTTRRFLSKACPCYGYVNGLTSLVIAGTKIPMALRSDKEAIGACLRTCTGIDRNNARIIRIKDTLHVGEIEISESLLEEARRNPNIEILGEPHDWQFDASGNLF